MTASAEPPPPDTQAQPRYINERVIEVLFSRKNEYRAVITQDSQGGFRVHRERWSVLDWNIARQAFWMDDDDRRVTIADSLEIARRLAQETLTATRDGFATPDI